MFVVAGLSTAKTRTKESAISASNKRRSMAGVNMATSLLGMPFWREPTFAGWSVECREHLRLNIGEPNPIKLAQLRSH
ncbi:MAG: hypothetical protein WA733_16120 [Methylocystis sp.]